MNGRDDTTTFLPLGFMMGGQNRDSYPMVRQYLTREQSRYIYKGRGRVNDKHGHSTTGNRARETVE